MLLFPLQHADNNGNDLFVSYVQNSSSGIFSSIPDIQGDQVFLLSHDAYVRYIPDDNFPDIPNFEDSGSSTFDFYIWDELVLCTCLSNLFLFLIYYSYQTQIYYPIFHLLMLIPH